LRRAVVQALFGLREELPNWMGFPLFTEDGYPLYPGTAGSILPSPGAVNVTRDGLRVEAVIQFPALLQSTRRERLWIQGGLLAVALGASLFAWFQARRAWRRQQDLVAQKDNFLASISHELRTPLASVRALTENLAAGTVPDEAGRQHYYKVMMQEMQRLSGLVENVLDFARISQQRKGYQMAPCDVPELVAAAVRLMAPLAARRGVTLREEFGELPCAPMADAAAVEQALINLMDNALKFAPANSVIRVQVRLVGRCWELAVEDEGPGIPPGEEERIFERFYRVGSELRRETPGAGIGLSLVRHTALGHGGTVFAGNRAGGGARVGLRLPLTTDNQPLKSDN
jgi:signal transduction histidine kinase